MTKIFRGKTIKLVVENFRKGKIIPIPVGIIPLVLNIFKADKLSAAENYFDTYHPIDSVEKICK